MADSTVVNMLPAEIYSAGLRSRGYAVANVVSMGMGFATQYSALPMYRRMQGWVWIFFSGVMCLAFFTIYFTYPETKGVRFLFFCLCGTLFDRNSRQT